MKRLLAAALALSITLASPLGAGTKVSAADNSDVNNAYYNLIEKLNKPDEFTGGYNRFKLIYVDNDDVPELLAVDTPADEYDNNGTYRYVLYTFYNGKAKKLGEFASGVASAGGYRGNTWYIKKSGKVYENYISAGSGEGSDIIYTMTSGKLKKKAKGDFHLATETCEWNGKPVSDEDYNSSLNKVFNTKKGKSFEEIKTISYSKMRSKLKG